MKENRPTDLAGQLQKRNPFESLRQEVFLNLIRTSDQLAREVETLLKSYEISSPQYNVMRILRGENQPMRVHQIAERMVTPQTDISRLVERMAGNGWIERQRCLEDRRVVWVTLTKRSKKLLAELDEPMLKIHESQMNALSDKELSKLNDLLFRARESHPLD